MLTSGTRVKFNENHEHAGDYGTILSVIPRRYRAEKLTYRVVVEGFPIAGGWDGKTFATEEQVEPVGTGGASGNTSRVKARPYGLA